MKLHLALLSLFAIPTIALASERPDGALGVNAVQLGATYSSFSYDAGYETDVEGGVVGVNYNLFSGESYGIDIGANYKYLNTPNRPGWGNLESQTYAFGATVYSKGALSPFFSAFGEYETNSVYSIDLDNDDAVIAGGTIGVEMHLTPGWYVTPKITYIYGISENVKSNHDSVAIFGVGTGYWITDAISVYGDISYTTYDDMNQTWFSFGATYRF
jgi:hypothetical protein